MFDNIKENVQNWNDDDELREYLKKMLHKQAFDNTGLVYGMGQEHNLFFHTHCDMLVELSFRN